VNEALRRKSVFVGGKVLRKTTYAEKTVLQDRQHNERVTFPSGMSAEEISTVSHPHAGHASLLLKTGFSGSSGRAIFGAKPFRSHLLRSFSFTWVAPGEWSRNWHLECCALRGQAASAEVPIAFDR